MTQTIAQQKFGQRRTLANRLDRHGFHSAAHLIRTRKIQIPGQEGNK